MSLPFGTSLGSMLPSLSTRQIEGSLFGPGFMSLSSGSVYFGGNKPSLLESFNYSLQRYGVFNHLFYNPQRSIGGMPTIGSMFANLEKLPFFANSPFSSKNFSSNGIPLGYDSGPAPSVDIPQSTYSSVAPASTEPATSSYVPDVSPDVPDHVPEPRRSEGTPASSVADPSGRTDASGASEAGGTGAANPADTSRVAPPVVAKPSRTLRLSSQFQPAGEVKLNDNPDIRRFIDAYNGDGSSITSPKMEICLKGGSLYLKLGYNDNVTIDQNSEEFKGFVAKLRGSIGQYSDAVICVGAMGEKDIGRLQRMEAKAVNGASLVTMYDKAFKPVDPNVGKASAAAVPEPEPRTNVSSDVVRVAGQLAAHSGELAAIASGDNHLNDFQAQVENRCPNVKVEIEENGGQTLVKITSKDGKKLSARESQLLLDQIRILAKKTFNVMISINGQHISTGRQSLSAAEIQKTRNAIASFGGTPT